MLLFFFILFNNFINSHFFTNFYQFIFFYSAVQWLLPTDAFFWRPMNLTCKLLFPLLFFDTYSTYNNIQCETKATGKYLKEIEKEQNKGRWRCWWFTANTSTGEENKPILDDHAELHMFLGVRYWPHAILNFGRIIFKSTNFMINKNFYS